ncbi:MAG TPA: ZIP family metal transporter [Polyangiaceae bacterium]|nr:ZIP family metal transporter [Polyangiaceae bacterium]
MTLLLILVGSLTGGVVSVLLAGTLLAVRPAALARLLPRLVSFSTGTLLGAALLGMIPHAAEAIPVPTLAVTLLLGLLAFFVLEKLLVWRHCHREHCEVHASSGPLLLVGDSVHNFVDGVIIAGAFLESTSLGLVTALSTIAHEVPQELGEFSVYLHAGYGRRRALLYNVLSSLTSVLGALLGYWFLRQLHGLGPYLLTFAAAGFLYVALADLVPAQRGKTTLRITLLDLLLVGLGIAAVAAMAHEH